MSVSLYVCAGLQRPRGQQAALKRTAQLCFPALRRVSRGSSDAPQRRRGAGFPPARPVTSRGAGPQLRAEPRGRSSGQSPGPRSGPAGRRAGSTARRRHLGQGQGRGRERKRRGSLMAIKGCYLRQRQKVGLERGFGLLERKHCCCRRAGSERRVGSGPGGPVPRGQGVGARRPRPGTPQLLGAARSQSHGGSPGGRRRRRPQRTLLPQGRSQPPGQARPGAAPTPHGAPHSSLRLPERAAACWPSGSLPPAASGRRRPRRAAD